MNHWINTMPWIIDLNPPLLIQGFLYVASVRVPEITIQYFWEGGDE